MPHPANKLFAKALSDRTVDSQKKEAFRKWRDKLAEGTEDRVEADRLWAEAERLGDAELGKNRPVMRIEPKRPPDDRNKSSRRRNDRKGPGGRDDRRNTRRPPTRQDTNNKGAADPSPLGEPFHNPYTFLPFPVANWFSGPRERRRPTPLTRDEVELDRFTGVVDVEILTLSPLLTCDPKETKEQGGHKSYQALTNGTDVIVPATGVRGSLRTLMSILTGGTLGYLDEGAWLVQGRDLPLGPAGKVSAPSVPQKCFLARVLAPGTETKAGKVKLGQTRLIKADDLERLYGRRLPRPKAGERVRHLWVNDGASSVSEERNDRHSWQLKLSGRPINRKGKREGLFLDDGPTIDVPPDLVRAYLGRHRHGDHPELKVEDLVWLEAKPGRNEIRSAADIESIQWARWGRRGESLEHVIRNRHPHLVPDSFNPDGKVDEVTDLFGQVPADKKEKKGAAGPFAARLRPDNLVFEDAAKGGLLEGVVLAPLAPPHPGCAAFYRDTGEDSAPDADRVTNANLSLRGYKVYRTTREREGNQPWLFTTQGVYDDDGRVKEGQQRVNKTCDLLAEGRTGRLRVSCRSLSTREVGLLLLACSVDWRLGGAKPLGLGHCRITRVRVRDETGTVVATVERSGDAPAELPEPYAGEVSDLLERRDLWHASQLPVHRLRYPRAANENNNRKQRGGHAWFQRHASPKKSADADRAAVGLQVLWTAGELESRAGANRIKAQPLPRFEPSQPNADVLYGYDLFSGSGPEWSDEGRDRRTYHKKLEAFDAKRHARASDQSGGKQGQSNKTREAERKRRRER